ncbi:MAG: TolC family protein [Bacteroidota bacterium]|nr:TolC family protein [Bacteroidota bacterium]
MKLFSLLSIIFFLSTGAIFGQQINVITLENAVNIALEKNLSIVKSQNAVDAAQAEVLAVYGDYLPTVSASARWGRNQSQTPESIIPTPVGYRWISIDPTTSIYAPTMIGMNQVGGKQLSSSYSTGLDLSYTLFDGFRRESNFNRVNAAAMSAEYTATRTKQFIRYSVESAYLNVLRKGQLVKVSDENLKRGRRQLERITESNRVGALSLADVYRQQSQVAADELNVINAQNDYDKAKADLAALIGLDMDTEYQFSDPSISTVIDQSELEATQQKYGRFDELKKHALTVRPDYLADLENLNAAESGVTYARSGYFPTISASAGYGLSNTELSKISDNKTLSWGINLRWNIFDAFRTNQSIQSAIAAKKTSETSLKQSEREITVEIKKALLDLESARKQVDVSQKGLVSATEDRRIAEERYNLGAGTLLDLLTANAGLVNAQANNINASYFYIIAKRNLEYVLSERMNYGK